MGVSNLHKLVAGVRGTGGFSVGFGGGGAGGAGSAGFSSDYKLVAEKLEEWEWFTRFMEMNPDIKERYAVHKTYEILNNDTRD